VVDFSHAFYYSKITKAPNINTGSAREMTFMFYNSYLTEFPSNLDFSKVASMQGFMYQCRINNLIIPSGTFTAEVGVYMSEAFRGCNQLKTADINIDKIRSASRLFNSCTALEYVNVHNLTPTSSDGFSQAFSGCSVLKTIDGVIDLYNVTSSLTSIIQYCSKLEIITLKNIRANITIGSGTSYGHLLTDNSIVNTFQELHDLTGKTAQTLTLSTPSNARTEAIYVKLIDITDEMRAEDEYIDNKKPCVVCESTDTGAMTLKEYGISKNWQIK
jgi:hypothetical protein